MTGIVVEVVRKSFSDFWSWKYGKSSHIFVCSRINATKCKISNLFENCCSSKWRAFWCSTKQNILVLLNYQRAAVFYTCYARVTLSSYSWSNATSSTKSEFTIYLFPETYFFCLLAASRSIPNARNLGRWMTNGCFRSSNWNESLVE